MKDIFNKRQRFSLRKYSVGVCSVLLGTALFAAGFGHHSHYRAGRMERQRGGKRLGQGQQPGSDRRGERTVRKPAVHPHTKLANGADWADPLPGV